MIRSSRRPWSTVATAVLAPAILVVLGGVLSGGLVAATHGGTLATAQVHELTVPSVPARVWGPPALTYSVAATPGASAHVGADVFSGAAGSTVPTPGVDGTASTGYGAGAFTPMTHCSKMPHIMDLKSH